MDLSTPIENLSGVGPQYQKKLKKLGIKTAGEAIFHFPHRYDDFSKVVKIAELKPEGLFSVQGKILDIKNLKTWKKRIYLTQALVGDDTGSVKAVWFNQPYLITTFKKGDFVFLAGKMASKEKGRYLSAPAYEKIQPREIESQNLDLTHTGRLIPVYPETEGLSSRWLRFIVKPLLIKLKNKIPDYLPKRIIKNYNLLPFQEAIWQIHFPDSLEGAKRAKERFMFEELFNISLFTFREKMKLAKEKAMPILFNIDLIKKFAEGLPFNLTNDQKKSAWQILKDLEKRKPMNRLLEGDVGSGKTVVAAIAVLNTIKAGYQTTIMAPTEILAKQHFRTINDLFKNFNLKIGLITSKESRLGDKKISRKEMLEKTKRGNINLLIGTHALVQNEKSKSKSSLAVSVKFKNLALVIIDEQHRFGVEQRARLCQRGGDRDEFIPHLLSMTATPIPRTLSLTVFGDLDFSLIKELPKGRKKIITKIIPPKERKKTYNFIRKEVKKGQQVFVICPRIEPSKFNLENSRWNEVKAVKEEYEKLSKEIFPDLKIGMLHGKMKNEEKEKIMRDFKNKDVDILVSTSVVEVGIDFPNATVMMIEGADKFGLAQLHQFRGRVGRGEKQSFCFLFTEFPAKRTNQRLRALISSENGFELAEKDLKIRGPGDFLGQRQWGIPDLVMDSLKNFSLVETIRTEAKNILNEDPEFKKYPLLKKKMEEFKKIVHLE